MATILNDAAYMALPMNIKRGNPIPLDTTAVWYNKTELENYAKTGATAYVGQVLTLVAGGKCEAYMISNEAGTLVKLAQTTTSGDLASDVANLQTQVEGLVEKVGSAAAGDTAASGLYKLIADVEAVAKARLESVEAGDNSITIAGSATEPSVAVKISKASGNALSLADDGLKVEIPEVKVPKYSLVKDKTAADGDVATYHLTKDGVNEGVAINIPKDLVVASGSVITAVAGKLPEGVTEAGTYIQLNLANSEKPLYINVGSLIEYVTGGSGENDAIQVNVSSDTHKVTANVKNGSLTKEMLAAGVVTSLGKADSAVQTVAAGKTNGTIKVDGTEIAVAGLQNAAFATVESINATAQGYVDTAKAALEGNDATDTDESATIKGAKKYADKVAKTASDNAGTALSNKIAELKNNDEAVANQFVTAVKETKGVVTVERKALTAEDIPELGQSKISGLTDALNAKQDTIAFDGEYSAQNKAATVSTVNSAAATIVGTDKDIDTSDTVKGAKKYADSKASAAINEAKAYVDGLIADDSGITKRVETLEGKVDVDKVSTAIATAKSAADAEAEKKDNALKTAILGNYAGTVENVYGLAQSAFDDGLNNTTAINTLSAKVGTIAQGKTVAGLISENATAISGINSKIGTVTEGKTVVEMIADAKTAATHNDAEVRGLITANKSAIDILIGSVEGDNNKSARDMAHEEVAKIVDGAPESFDTLKEISSWISNHSDSAVKMDNSIKANAAAIEKLNGADTVVGSVAKAVKDGVAPVSARVTAIEGKVTDAKIAQWDKGQANVIESIKVNNVAQAVDGKAVNIAVPVADDTSIAITENKIGIKAVDVQKLFVAEGDVLIIDGGKA